MRGKVIKIADFYGVSRITPAYAGKSYNFLTIFQFTQDHPRLCGEKYAVGDYVTVQNGITPAYAGKRKIKMGRNTSSWDHPRLCGEKGICRSFFADSAGSPPPMRGKAFSLPRHKKGTGITPAYAGKRYGTRWHGNPDKDHPRLCGEKILLYPLYLFCGGSPPPMRGKGV